MAFNATEDRVILKLDESGEEVQASGFIVPRRSPPDEGEIVAAGPGRYAENGTVIPMEVSVGQMVKFDKNMAYGIEIEGENYVVIPQAGILGVIGEGSW